MGCQRTRGERKEGKGGDKKKGEREGKEREMREKRGRGGEERGKRKGDAADSWIRPWMGDCLRAGKLSQYVTSHPGQLSLAIPLWVGEMSTSLN